MRAIQFSRFGDVDVLECVERSLSPPGSGELQIDVHAVSVNPVDAKIRSGKLPVPITLPAVTGRDGAGVVREAGASVDAGLVGKRVCFLAPRGVGTWADMVTLPASSIVAIPDSLSITDAAALPLAGLSAWIGLVTTGQVAAGQRVLIHGGAGGVGGYAVQIARRAGAYVIATASARNVDYVRGLGAHEVIAYDAGPFEAATDDVDLLLDLIGGDIHRRSYEVMRRGGTLVYLNAAPIEDRGAAYSVHVAMAQIVPEPEALAIVVRLVEEGAIRPTIEKVLPFEAYREAQALIEEGHRRGKIVLSLR